MAADFKSWFLVEEAISKKQLFFQLIEQVFGRVDLQVTDFPDGGFVAGIPLEDRQINLTYSVRPLLVKVSFFFPKPTERTGEPSEKDSAVNAVILPTTMPVMRRLVALVDLLGKNGFKVTYDPTDKRRADFYSKIMNRSGFTPIDTKYNRAGEYTWEKPA